MACCGQTFNEGRGPRMRNHAAALALLVALSGCGDGGDPSGDAATGLAGLYEGGEGPRRNQLCVAERDGAARFGLILWAGQGNNSCTGKGRATRQGERLSLAMQGDESCVIEARIRGSRITLPGTLPPSCSYYCGPGVEMAGARFDQAGDSDGDARRAVDLVGDPLCD